MQAEANAVQKFNAELDNQRDQFNAQNSISDCTE